MVARAVQDPEIADEITGFHTQQAGEKILKAVLCVHGITYRRTHDLQELYDLLSDNGVVPPDAEQDLVAWSPFAVAYRYEEWTEPEPVDRAEAERLVRAAIAWCEQQVPGQ